MNEVIQSLKANATNGKENFCYISENMLNAIKELSKREYQEKENLQSRFYQKINKINSIIDYIDSPAFSEQFENVENEDNVRKHILEIIKKVED